jgi:hypothetical protein
MNSYLASKISSFCVTLPVSEKVRNSPLLPAWTQVRGVSRDAEALCAIRVLHPKGIINLNIVPMDGLMSQSTGRVRATLDHNLLRSE